MRLLAAITAAVACGCALGSQGYVVHDQPDATSGDDGSAVDAGDAGADSADATTSDAATDSAIDAHLDAPVGADAAGDADAAVDAGLDPLLDLADAAGQPCSPPGSSNGCPSLEVCRIATQTGGRCEGCGSCNNLGASCAASDECDILFQCYAGRCTGICPLGTSYCGAVTDCLDVGNTS